MCVYIYIYIYTSCASCVAPSHRKRAPSTLGEALANMWCCCVSTLKWTSAIPLQALLSFIGLLCQRWHNNPQHICKLSGLLLPQSARYIFFAKNGASSLHTSLHAYFRHIFIFFALLTHFYFDNSISTLRYLSTLLTHFYFQGTSSSRRAAGGSPTSWSPARSWRGAGGIRSNARLR